MSALAERPVAVEKEGRFKFAADFPFVRTVMDEEKAADFTSRFGEKLPNAQPKAAKGDALLQGYANTWVMDRDFEFIGRRAFDKTLPDYLRKNPIILLQHNHDWPLGQVMDAATDDTGLGMDGYVRQPQDRDPDWKHGAYNDIVAGILRTLSIGGFFYREIVDNEILVTEIDLFEISVVAVPSNPDSIFEAARKSALGLDLRNPQGSARLADMMQQLLGMKELTDPSLAGQPEIARRSRYYELAAQWQKQAGALAPDYHDWRNIAVQLDREQADHKAIGQQVEGFMRNNEALFGKATVSGPVAVGEKAGRVLSKANEGKLRGAVEKAQGAVEGILGVLDQLPTEGENAAIRESIKGVFAEIMAGYDLQETMWDGFWAFREALCRVMDPDGDYVPDVGNIPLAAVVETCNEFRDWLIGAIQAAGSGQEALAVVNEDLRLLGSVLGVREPKAERHCPSCGTYMKDEEGAACPNCGTVLTVTVEGI